MATEEQTQHNTNALLIHVAAQNSTTYGQRLTISDRTVTKLGFWLQKVNSPTGDIYFRIRKVSDNSLVASKLLGDASTISTNITYYEVTFDTPVYINEEVRIYAFIDTTLWPHSTNYLNFRYQNTDVKASEFLAYVLGGYLDSDNQWNGMVGSDCAYIYTYNSPPTVTTQAVTAITPTTATGNGNITDLGASSVTQHGHCWSTLANPTTADSKTENGAGSVGAFTSAITGLLPLTLYHTRAYAINSYGTSYGADVEFTTLSGFIPKIFFV